MKLEEKELLLKDLCARLLYDVKCYIPLEDAIMTLTGKRLNYFCFHKVEWGLDYRHEYETVLDPLNSDSSIIKPYLRPMSSMTDEEKKKLKADTCPEGTGYFDEKYLICPMNHFGELISYELMSAILEWLNSHHFDYRGLIGKGLALKAPEGMYK